MILKDVVDSKVLTGPVLFEYKDVKYNTSIPTIDDFIEDNYQYLLYKEVCCIEPVITEDGAGLVIRLKDY